MEIAPINHIEIRDGRAIIAGTGLKVANIATMYVHLNTSVDWIVENYDLTAAQVYAAVSYYYDHREDIDREVQEGDELARKYGISSEEVLKKMRERQQK